MFRIPVPMPLFNHSTFPIFLKNNYETICENIERYLKQQHDISSLSRLFNELPNQYLDVEPLLSTLEEALLNKEFSAWLEFSLAFAMNDLFTMHGKLRKDIYKILNIDDILLGFYQKLGEDKVNIGLLSAFLVSIIGEHAASIVGKMKENDLEDALLKPSYIYSHESNCRLGEFNTLRKKERDDIQTSLIETYSCLKSKKLEQLIQDFTFNKEYEALLESIILMRLDVAELSPEKVKLVRHFADSASLFMKRIQQPFSVKFKLELTKTLRSIRNLIENPTMATFEACRKQIDVIQQSGLHETIISHLMSLTSKAKFLVSSNEKKNDARENDFATGGIRAAINIAGLKRRR